MLTVRLGASGLTADEVVSVARHDADVEVTDEALAAMARSRAIVERLADSDVPAYGVSTGFGALATVAIPRERRRDLQRALIRSHAAGAGAPLEREVVRALMLLRARTLALGYSGARPVVCETLVALLAHGITPVVPEYGSLGCSGDLAPLAHVALALLGEGEVESPAGREPAAVALARAGIAPLELAEKEGLALINGTDGMLGTLVLACADLRLLVRAADVAAALSVEALLGTDRAFADDLVGLRPHPGARASAGNLTRLLIGSPIVASHREGDARVQDAYSLRCAPQVAGTLRDTLAWVESTLDIELRSAIDNPIVTLDGRVESCGNFHGAPLAHAADALAVALVPLASIAERRTDRLLDRTRSHGLPPFLADDAGVDSGLMIGHYTQAVLVAELKRLAVPASVDSIPTSAMQEDHVSMGFAAVRKLRRSIELARQAVAIELLAGARGVDLRAPLVPGAGTGAAVAALRRHVAGAGPDRELAPELAAAERALDEVVAAVEAAIGPLV